MINEPIKSTELIQTQSITPLKRLMVAFIFGEIGVYIAMLTPGIILLTLRVNELDPKNAISTFGWISGITALVALVSMPIGGFISDRIRLKFGKRKTIILIGVILGVFSLMGMAVSTTILMLGVFTWLTAAGTNMAQAGFSALLADQVEESKRGSVSGIIGVLAMCGMFVGMALVSIMAKASNIEKFGALAIASIIGTIIACSLIKDTPAERRNSEKSGENKIPFRKVISSIYPSPRKYPIFTWGILTRFCVTVASCATTYNSMMLIQRYHYSQEAATHLTGILQFAGLPAMMISSILGGILSDKIRRQKIFVMVSPIVVGLALVLMGFASNFTTVFVATLIIQFGFGIYTSVDGALTVRILPKKEDYAKDMGIMNIASSLPQSIVPFIAPLLLGLGGWKFYFFFLAVFGLLSALAVIPIPDLTRKPKEV
ncbi:MFS transporter [Neobacillus vireti]|uniref:MFS transporter n=1 Tax=Neobacillus vireti TaxID=220686 RepID=UPI002FFFA613